MLRTEDCQRQFYLSVSDAYIFYFLPYIINMFKTFQVNPSPTLMPKLMLLPCVNQAWQIETRGGGVTPLYGLYRYVRPQRVGFFSHFGHK